VSGVATMDLSLPMEVAIGLGISAETPRLRARLLRIYKNELLPC
jgi:hypothetical protein